MIGLCVALLICVAIARIACTLVSIVRSQHLIERGVPEGVGRRLPRIVVVLPVLREKRIIAETLAYFSRLEYPRERYGIVVVTTERERAAGSRPDTIDAVRSLAQEYPGIQLLHYPYRGGCKADQLNYAAANLGHLFPEADPVSTFYAFYDADSRPERDILLIFTRVLARHEHAHVFQQSASYLQNYDALDRQGFLAGGLLKAQALKQTRFSLAYEIPRIRRVWRASAGRSRRLLDWVTYAPTIGHGLFVRASFLDVVRFPPGYTPEDMFWGFLVTSMGEPIVLVPSLDRSETPDSIGAVFRQLASWFKGPLLVGFRYRLFLKENYPLVFRQNRVRITLMSLFALADAAGWLATSFFAWLCLVAGVLWPGTLPLTVALIALYLAGILFVMDRHRPPARVTFREKLVAAAFSLLLPLVYSAPPLFTLVQLARGRTVFHKTER